MTLTGIRERAPTGEALTDYDREHAALYLRLLDAEGVGADWRDVARVVFGIDPSEEPERAKTMHASHLARAQWLRANGYKDMLSKHKS